MIIDTDFEVIMEIIIDYNGTPLLFTSELRDSALGMIVKRDDGLWVLTCCLPAKITRKQIAEIKRAVKAHSVDGATILYVGMAHIKFHSTIVGDIYHLWYFYFDKFEHRFTVTSRAIDLPPKSNSLSMYGKLFSESNGTTRSRFKTMITKAMKKTVVFDESTQRLIEKQ
jgi:hypothetical protein